MMMQTILEGLLSEPEQLALSRSSSALDCLACKKTPSKCCNFQPFVPNFFLGEAITRVSRPDPPSDFNGPVTAIFANASILSPGTLLTPIGLMPSAAFREQHSIAPETTRCSFYLINGQCQIWESRPAECRSYFCESREPASQLTSARNRLSAFDVAVSQMALIHQGYEITVIDQLVDGLNNPHVIKTEDLTWSAQELSDTFLMSFEYARQLDPKEVMSWDGFDTLVGLE